MAPARSAPALPLGLLAAAGFLSASGARIVDPLLPLIAGQFHVGIPRVSIVIAAFTLPYGLNQIVLGPVGDRFGKLRVLLGALFGYAVATAGCAMAADLPTLVLLRVCAGAASAGLIPTALAYIGDSVPYADRQLAMSRFLTGVGVAQILAGPIGGLVGQELGWRTAFLLLTSLAGALAILLATRIRRLPDTADPAALGQTRRHVALLLQVRGSRRLLLSVLAEGALFAGSFPLLAPYFVNHLRLSVGGAGLLLACFGLGIFLYTRTAKHLIRHLSEPLQVLLGASVTAGALALGIGRGSWPLFIPVEMALGFGYFALHSVLLARASEMLPEARSTAVAGFAFMLFLGQSVGALGLAHLVGAVGYSTAFMIDASLILLLGLWLTALIEGTRPDGRAAAATPLGATPSGDQ